MKDTQGIDFVATWNPCINKIKKDVRTVDDIKKVFDDAAARKPAEAVTLDLRNGAVKSTVTLQPASPTTNK